MINNPPNDKMIHSDDNRITKKSKKNLKKNVKITPSWPGVETGLAPPSPVIDSGLPFSED